MRSDERYFADIQTAIRDYYHPRDELRLVRFYQDNRKCEMCGGMVDIKNCFDLQNVRTGKIITCGEKCIARYADVIERMGLTPSIVFPFSLKNKAELINIKRPNTIVIEPLEEEWVDDIWNPNEFIGQRATADDLDPHDVIADGLDPDEFDWDSHDYE